MLAHKPFFFLVYQGPLGSSNAITNAVGGLNLFTNASKGRHPSKLAKRDGNAAASRPTHSQRKAQASTPCSNIKWGSIPIPKGFRTSFNPITELNLSKAQVELCAYVFSPDHDPKEVIVQISELSATRQELQCICPGKIVDDKIISLIALKCTWRQRCMTSKTVWCLPPSFAEDISQGQTLEYLLDTYAKVYMPTTPQLQYIYVPIKEGSHWYLMVVCLMQKIIYHLDSFLPPYLVEPRSYTIKTVSEVLAQMLSTECYTGDGLRHCHDFNGGWDIIEARGIPNCGRSDDSAVWVLGWMDMEYAFNPNFSGSLNDDDVRIKTATELILGDCNELKKIIEARCSAHWRSLN